MTRSYVVVYVNDKSEDNIVRRFGGNDFDISKIVNKYSKMNKQKFLKKHPKFTDKCKDDFKLIVQTNLPSYY